MTVSELKYELGKAARPEKARVLSRFFKTGRGEYGEGDKFLGVVVPDQRRIAKGYFTARGPAPMEPTLAAVGELLQSGFHEERLVALLILLEQYRRGDDRQKKLVFEFYLANLDRVNNWDLVDLSAPGIVGGYLLDKSPALLFDLAKSGSLWARRVAVLATLSFIRQGRFSEMLILAEQLLVKGNEPHDLIHKAVGWMLREVGNRDRNLLEEFLKQFAARLPRTALRYAIEKFPENKRQEYLGLGRNCARDRQTL